MPWCCLRRCQGGPWWTSSLGFMRKIGPGGPVGGGKRLNTDVTRYICQQEAKVLKKHMIYATRHDVRLPQFDVSSTAAGDAPFHGSVVYSI
jgi:hypothetical protein